MASQPTRSCGPFTTSDPARSTVVVLTSRVVAPNLPTRFQRFLGSDSAKGHPAHVSSLSGPDTPGLVCGQLYANPCLEVTVLLARVFPSPFGVSPFASWPSCSRPGFPRPLRFAYRWLVISTGPDGVPMFRIGEIRPGSGALYTPGPWCSHDRLVDSGHHCRHLKRLVLSSGDPSHHPELCLTRLTRVHIHSPFRSSPCL
jgi:hypothetical protein